MLKVYIMKSFFLLFLSGQDVLNCPTPCDIKSAVKKAALHFPLVSQVGTESRKHSLARHVLAAGLHKCVDDLTSHILFCAALTLGRESEFLTTKIAAFLCIDRYRHTQVLSSSVMKL